MSSNSLRISAQLFEQAQQQGSVLSRSAAQQLEHWARLGMALERRGLSVDEIVALLRGDVAGLEASARDLWSAKRAQQARDIAAIESGTSSNAAMSWFSRGRARRAQVIDSPL